MSGRINPPRCGARGRSNDVARCRKVEYQHFDVGAARAFCVNPGCVVPAVRDFDLSASGDIVRARLTVKTHGFGFGPAGGVGG
jgi:hypothetical protein